MGYLLWVAASNLSPQHADGDKLLPRESEHPPGSENSGEDRVSPHIDFRRIFFARMGDSPQTGPMGGRSGSGILFE